MMINNAKYKYIGLQLNNRVHVHLSYLVNQYYSMRTFRGHKTFFVITINKIIKIKGSDANEFVN